MHFEMEANGDKWMDEFVAKKIIIHQPEDDVTFYCMMK